jgi:hypothetical protein
LNDKLVMGNFIDISNRQYSRLEIYLSMLLKRIYLLEINVIKYHIYHYSWKAVVHHS